MKVEKALTDLLYSVAKDGIEERFFETTLHQLEFSNKRTKDHFGLATLSHMLPYLLHGGNALDMFKIDEFSARIREDFKRGGMFEGLVQKHLIDNQHKLVLTFVPTEGLGEKEEEAEKIKLERLKKALTDEEKATIVSDA